MLHYPDRPSITKGASREPREAGVKIREGHKGDKLLVLEMEEGSEAGNFRELLEVGKCKPKNQPPGGKQICWSLPLPNGTQVSLLTSRAI